MGQAQISTLVGGSQIVGEELFDTTEDGKSPLSDTTFSNTKDRYSLEIALSKIYWLLGGTYTRSYLDSLTTNDLLYEVRLNAEVIDNASETATVRSYDTNYNRGDYVTESGQTWQATNDGTTDVAAEPPVPPVGPSTIGETVTDGTVVWVRTA